MSDASKLVNDLIAFIHGKKPATTLSADAQKLLEDVEKVATSLVAAGPYAPAILSDVAALAAEGAALVASKGADIPEFLAAGATLEKLAADLAKAEAAFTAAMAAYRASAGVVAHTPKT